MSCLIMARLREPCPPSPDLEIYADDKLGHELTV